MPLCIVPLSEADCEDWAALYYLAFGPTSLGCMWHSQPTAESNRQFGDFLRAGLGKPHEHVFKCVDTDLGDGQKLIAVAKWSVFAQPRSPAEVEAGFIIRPTFPGENRAARVEFMENIFSSRRQRLHGEPHVILESLLCHPQHQRRGAGRMLMQFGIDKADELGIIGYLEGSKMGAPLYQSVGYVKVGELEWKTAKHGGDQDDVHAVMIRQPRSKKM